MTQSTSFKKGAFLTGLTMLVSGVEIPTADAATIVAPPSPISFSVLILDIPFEVSQTFQQFDSSLGKLTGVTFDLSSNLNIDNSGAAATVTVNSTTLFSQVISGPFNGSASVASDPFYIGLGTFPVTFNRACEGVLCGTQWSAEFSVTYTYDPASLNAVPLPAALPLFATGLGVLGLLGWRRKRKAPNDLR